MSIKAKMSVLIIVALTIVMVGVTVISIKLFKGEIKELLQEQTVEKVEFLNEFLETYLSTPIHLVEKTAQSISKPEADSEKQALNEMLQIKADGIEGILGIHVGFTGDKTLYSSENVELDPDYNATERDWFKEALASPEQVIVTDPYTDAFTGKLIVGVSKAMADGAGVVTLDLDLDFLEELVPTITIGDEGYTFVFDANGNVLYHPNYAQNESVVDTPFYTEFLNNEYLETVSGGRDVFINRFYNERMNWQIGSIYPYTDVERSYKQLVAPISTLNAISIIGLSIIFFFILTKFLRPLQTVTQFAEKVANGNLKEHVVVQTEDEIGQLSTSFNNMTSGLKEMIRSVDHTADHLNTFSADVSASVEENVQSIHQVVEHIQEVSKQSRDQLSSATSVEQAVTHMGNEVTQLTSNVEQVIVSAQTAEQETNKGVAVMTQVKEQMGQIQQQSNETATNFNDLIRVANEIQTFSNAISGIADQTNLLALNASIEAARAGEHGKGFAVVADEVRKLAEQTNASVNEIQSLVATIHQTGTVATKSLEASHETVHKGMIQIEEASNMFNTIHDVMGELTDKITAAQRSITALDQRKDYALQSATTIAEATKQVNASIEQVAATTEEQNAAMEQMAISAEQLATQAQQLQQLIRQFEV